jgi:hypothetical protein
MELLNNLKDIAGQIRRLEDEASVALYELDDKETYTEKLFRKTEILHQLPQTCDQEMRDVSPEVQSFIRDRVGGMSFSAGKALQLNSIFYMSALLYPEGYKDGDRNDLENFIAGLENLLK